MHCLHCGSASLIVLSFSLSAVLAFTPNRVSAQGVPTESKGMDLAAFGGYVNIAPDYGSSRDNGFLLGADLTRYFHWPVAPSLEIRTNLANGPIANEDSYLVGLRAQVDLHRFHPYADFLIGYGSIHYDIPPSPGYTHDNSVVKSFGAGLDYDVTRNFQARIDFQSQHWTLGPGDTLTPTALSFGIRYVIPFKPHVGER